VGDTQYRHVDLRLISATNKDLQREVERGNFRADLYYRLNTFPITMPALRECRRDIPVLAEHFLAKHRQGINDSIIALNGETVASLCAYDFPGNIRELENLVIRALVVDRRERDHARILVAQGGKTQASRAARAPR
jgi:transcriptional regulator with GAF, ATPase, and Fis domain